MTTRISQCAACRHSYPGGEAQEYRTACRAFPHGIPQSVYDNRMDHRLPFEGDHGVQFAPREGMKHPLDRSDPALVAPPTGPDQEKPLDPSL